MGNEVELSLEWTRAGDGRIDIKNIKPRWGSELLRDGDCLAQRSIIAGLLMGARTVHGYRAGAAIDY
jgi:hypothetical protein